MNAVSPATVVAVIFLRCFRLGGAISCSDSCYKCNECPYGPTSELSLVVNSCQENGSVTFYSTGFQTSLMYTCYNGSTDPATGSLKPYDEKMFAPSISGISGTIMFSGLPVADEIYCVFIGCTYLQFDDCWMFSNESHTCSTVLKSFTRTIEPATTSLIFTTLQITATEPVTTSLIPSTTQIPTITYETTPGASKNISVFTAGSSEVNTNHLAIYVAITMIILILGAVAAVVLTAGLFLQHIEKRKRLNLTEEAKKVTLVKNVVYTLDEWDKASLTPTILEQLLVISNDTGYLSDTDSRTESTSLCTEVVGSLQSVAHNSRNDDSNSEELLCTHFKQGHCSELQKQKAGKNKSSSCDLILFPDRDVVDQSFSIYRKSQDSIDGYIFPETTANLEKDYSERKPYASNSSTAIVREFTTIKKVHSADAALNQQSAIASKDTQNSTIKPDYSHSANICHTSIIPPETNHSSVHTRNTFDCGANLSHSQSEPTISKDAEMKGRHIKVFDPVKKTPEVFSFPAILSDAENYMESSDCDDTFDDDDDDQYVDCTVPKMQPCNS